jgi:hypothetical protein
MGWRACGARPMLAATLWDGQHGAAAAQQATRFLSPYLLRHAKTQTRAGA